MVFALPPSYLIATVAGDGCTISSSNYYYTGYISCSSSGDGGMANSASINNPVGIWQDSVGTLFIVEKNGNIVRAVSSSGIISTVAGTGIKSTSTTDLNGVNGPVGLLS
jgi:hypothetical protein